MVHINLIPNSGIFDTIFHKTWIGINVLGLPTNTSVNSAGQPVSGGYGLSLAGLIIIVILALAVAGITERLTGAKPGGLMAASLITLIGAWLFQTYINFGVDIVLEGVRLIAALIGAVIVAVFYNLIRKQFSSGK